MLPDWTVLVIGPLVATIYYLLIAWAFNAWPFRKNKGDGC